MSLPSSGMSEPIPVVVIPNRDELERRLSASADIDDRIRYVQGLLSEAMKLARAVENLQRDLGRERDAKESMAAELRALRQQVGDLSPGDRAAGQRVQAMTTQMHKARNELDRFIAAVDVAAKGMADALKKPK